MNRRFEFQKRSQLFIRVHNESLSVVAMLNPQRTVLTSLTRFAIKALLIRGAFYLLLLLTVYVIAFAVGQRLIGAPSPKDNPAGFVCFGCPLPGGWRPGPDMPSTGVPTVGVLLNNVYAMGGRSMDGVGNDFTHPFEYDTFTQTWTIFRLRP